MSQSVQAVDTAEFDITLRNLEKFDEAANKHFRPALNKASKMLLDAARPKVPVLTGRAQAALSKSVTGKGMTLTGYVGWKRDRATGIPWYVNVVEYGAKPHPLEKGETVRTKKGAARAAKVGAPSTPVYIAKVGWRTMTMHPGFSPRRMLTSTYEEKADDVTAIMGAASDQVLAEVAGGH